MLAAAARIADGQVPVPRLLVVLPAGPAATCSGRCGSCSGRRCCRGGSCACSATPPSALLAWRLARRGGAARRRRAGGVAGGGPGDGLSERARTPSRRRSRSCSARCSLFERRPVRRGCWSGWPPSGGWSSPPTRARHPARLRRARARPRARGALRRRSGRRRPRWPTRRLVASAGVGPALDLLVDYPLTTSPTTRRLPFPLDYRRPAEHRLAGRLPLGLGRGPARLLPPARAGGRAGGGAWLGAALRAWRAGALAAACSRWAWRTTW